MSKNKQEELPIIKSLSLHKHNGLWSVLTISTQGNEVINVEMTEPNMRDISISELKIKVMKELIDASADA